MKNNFRLFGIIALVALIGFLTMGCGGGNNDTPPPQPPPGTNGTNGEPPPDPDTGARHVYGEPFMNMLTLINSPLTQTVTSGSSVALLELGPPAVFGPLAPPIADDAGTIDWVAGTPTEAPYFIFGVIPSHVDHPQFGTGVGVGDARWVPAPGDGAGARLAIHVSGRNDDRDGVALDLNLLNVAVSNPTRPMLGAQGRQVNQLQRGDLITITGRTEALRAYGDRRIALVRAGFTPGASGAPAPSASLEEAIWDRPTGATAGREELTSQVIPNTAGTHPFTLQWIIVPRNDYEASFGQIGVITESSAGNNLHASGIADIFIEEITIQRAIMIPIAVTAAHVTRDTEGVRFENRTAAQGGGLEVRIMPQIDGAAEDRSLHRGVTFAFGRSSGTRYAANNPNVRDVHLNVRDWADFGWISVVVPEYRNHELNFVNNNHDGPIDSTAFISLLIAHGWDLGSEANPIGDPGDPTVVGRAPNLGRNHRKLGR